MATFPNPETAFKPGTSGNPNGRPRKWVSQLKQEGYKLSEVNDALSVLLSMSYEQLAEVWNDPNSTALEKAVCKAIQTDMKRGRLDTIEILLSRLFGRPRNEIVGKGGEDLLRKIVVEIVDTQPSENPIVEQKE